MLAKVMTVIMTTTRLVILGVLITITYFDDDFLLRDWLPADIPNLRILGVDYATSMSHWKSRCPDDARR